MTPVVQIAASDADGIGGALLGRMGALGALAGGLKFKEAETSLLIADLRSGIQVAAAEGKASKTEFSIGGWGLGGAALGGYSRTPEGKVVAASLLDNYNKVVVAIRDKPQLIRPGSAAGDANAAVSTRAEAPQRVGQMLAAKIANVKVFQEPSRDSPVLATLQRSDELVASGEARNGFVQVDAANFSGWVQRTLVGPATGSPAPMAAAAPAVVALAPAPAPAPAPALGTSLQAPAVNYRYGNFAGTADGADKGSFRVLVDDRGRITGEGGFSRIGVFGLMGQYDAKEDAVMMHGSSGAGGLLFVGRYDAARGVISGSWTMGGAAGLMTGAGGGGTFSAQRQ